MQPDPDQFRVLRGELVNQLLRHDLTWRRGTPRVAQVLHREVIEVNDGVSLRPQADFPRILERAVFSRELELAVVETLKVIAAGFHLDLMPGVGCNFEVRASKLHASALDDV